MWWRIHINLWTSYVHAQEVPTHAHTYIYISKLYLAHKKLDSMIPLYLESLKFTL